ncbi:non-ribosomal peptide synthetase [Kutzneria buriramensis]|uniref:Amino acid adenylation domain-containing protein n=1 Tax=Kutzneria buriramensis TaxID=1045776 RepID=A0A3E0H6T1_9PSEU|nr:non-ribosomal peptide synthetase [Kutzneria buriramensis]REH39191.1 amino acid adenylation domain-containing protein [Kutzneria buriramensis]
MTSTTTRRGVTDAYPLSRLQAGMIYHAELAGDASYYHDIYSLRVHGPWDEDAFRHALHGLVAAHETLRTSFELTKFSEPLQLVHAEAEVPFEVIDLRGHQDLDGTLERWRRTEVGNAFDLSSAPLFRFVVHLVGENEFHFWWSFHHAIMDGWSLHSAVAELFAGYAAARQGRDPQFATPRTRFRDFVALELDALDDEDAEEFWQGELAGAEPALLPTPTKRADAIGTVEVSWHDAPDKTVVGVTELAERLRVPVRTVLLAAHLRVSAALLGRHDVITGVIGNGRPETSDAEQVKGLFIGTYPFRLELADSWSGFVASVFAKETAILPHRRYPLAAMVEHTGWNPFDIVFDFRRFRSYEGLSSQDDLSFDIGAYYEHTNFPITSGFVMTPDGSSLRLQIRYDAGRFDPADVDRISRGYLAVLERIATDPESSVVATSALADEDLDALAAHAAGPKLALDGPAGLYQRIETGSELAVRAVDGELDYDELHDLAGRIGGYLAAAGVKRGDPVGVCMNRNRLLLPALLGVLRIGANYVPLDPEYPIDRLRYIAEHSESAVLLYDEASAAVAAELKPQALSVEAAAEHDGAAAPVEVSGDDIAYTIYTSGSTGLPKGVQVRHRAVINLLESLGEVLDADEDMVHLATTSISFDIHVNEVFLPLIRGGSVLLAAREQVSDGTELRSLIESEPGLAAQGPPAMWRMLLDAGWRPYGMSHVLCGGEAFPRELADRLTADGVPVWNVYGPTETTVWSAVQRVAATGSMVPIGRPLGNTTMWILDKQMAPVFPGVPGELHIGGDGVARAYHRRPDLTADRFVPDPFSGNGSRLYRTGDLVRTLDDGTYEYLERVDLQVKVRGYRIELEEIEARIDTHPDVSMGVAAAPMGSDGERILVGYVVARNEIDGAKLREWCSQALPHYMVPQAWVFLDELPKTPNGKVDRKALPAIGGEASVGGDTTEPGTETERVLAEIWREVLELPAVGVHANFFDLGGHSLRALRVVLKVRERLQVELPVAAMIHASTIHRLAALIDRDKPGQNPLVMPLNETGRPTLFLFHPLGGHVFGYAPLSRELDGKVTVQAVRASGMEPGEPLRDSLADLVDAYLTELRAIQPHGPYNLAGWCMGASVAVETARRLRSEGEQVDFLGLIVANPFDPAPRILLNDSTALVQHMLGEGLDLDYDELAALGDTDRQVDYVLNRGSSRADVSSVDDAKRLLAVYQANARAITARTLPDYDGEAHVFVLPAENPTPPDMGWSKILTGPVRQHELPGGATTFLDPDQVSQLAAILAAEVGSAR